MARKLHRLSTTAVLGSLLAFAAFASPASADILISSPNPSPVCGDAIEVGIWYRDFPTKQTQRQRRMVIKAIDDSTGKVWWTKKATATKQWRYWYLPSGKGGQCGPTTVAYYKGGKRYGKPIKIRFRSEGV